MEEDVSSGQVAAGREPAGGAAGDTSINPGGVRPGSPNPVLDRLRDRASELGTAVRKFREWSRDYRLDRIGCTELVRGYEAVDRAMVDLARTYMGVRDRLEAEQE